LFFFFFFVAAVEAGSGFESSRSNGSLAGGSAERRCHLLDRAARAGYPVLACVTHAPDASGVARSVFDRPPLAEAA
ncbi:MAG: hypothetical protein ACK4ST_16815, partial [Elioraea tepidiphila]